MKRELTVALVGAAALVAATGAAIAHHSTAMFDQENPIELVGIVKEFKFTNPHAFILLEVKGGDGSATVWTLEGGTPSSLTREGWTNKSIKPGDEIKAIAQRRPRRLLVGRAHPLPRRKTDRGEPLKARPSPKGERPCITRVYWA